MRAGRRIIALAAVLALSATAAACGGDDDSEPAASSAAAPATSAAAPATSAAAAADSTMAAASEATSEAAASGAVEVSADGLGSKFDVASAGDVELDLWWLGNLEAPGIEPWMDEMVAAFEAEHPNVKIKATPYQTDTWVQTQTTACQSKTGPDLWYNWSGSWSLGPAWNGCTVANEDVLDASDISANPATQETVYDGQTWVFPLYKFVYPMVYNKGLVEAAGLDFSTPPATWDEFVAALDKIKATGTTPIALGLKDGFGAEIFAAGQLEKQPFSSPTDIMQMVVDKDLQSPEWRQWIEKAFALKPYFNEDANSIGFAEASGLFQAGKTAMVAGGPGVPSVMKAMQDAGTDVGVFMMPAFGTGSWASGLANTGNGFQVLSSSDQQKVAGAFMAFMQRPENLDKLYAATGTFPTSSNWTQSGVTSENDKQQLAALAENGSTWWVANYTPVDLDVNGTFVVWQKMMAGELDVDGAVKLYQDVLDTWAAANGPALENYSKWLTG